MNRWPIARYLLTTHFPFLVLVVAGLYAACGVILAVVAQFTEIRISTVDVAGQVLCWLALGYGTSVTMLLNTMLVHGRTRRELLRQYPVFVVLLATTLAALIATVYAGEAALYQAFDWQQKLQDHRLYESATDFSGVFVAHLSMLLVWLLSGAFLGVAFYRWESNGIVALPIAAALVLVNGGFTGFFSVVPALRAETAGPGTVLAVTALLAAVAWGLLWATARDMSLRPRSA